MEKRRCVQKHGVFFVPTGSNKFPLDFCIRGGQARKVWRRVVRLEEKKQIPWRRWTRQASKEMRSCWEGSFLWGKLGWIDSGDNKEGAEQ